ncbi:hypothetical protein EM6_0376 [Asticcacaulis excentricus]|uniref:Uncharacterized protein n=1 Tax=Asticcacaulis excentricus TaxID=78587 RepID=A0A3G9G4C0_9CAUL|nr:hypothetical protein EM6_0376 [Asticcacaulis excentricus]
MALWCAAIKALTLAEDVNAVAAMVNGAAITVAAVDPSAALRVHKPICIPLASGQEAMSACAAKMRKA